ncbi:methyltransferase family protein [Prosthecomicrobium sp. N25]|uniref:methyltransferase family protein n=1 Tax=Prosthecomicrobium sp. N25 TaxID=3129254 RepID=UPI003076F7A2
MTFDAFARGFMACYFGFVALHYTVRLLAFRARTGWSHADPGARGSANWRHQSVFRLFRASILIVCVARVPFPGIDQLLLPFEALANRPAVVATGILLMIAALGAVDYVHSYLEADWRSGTGGRMPSRLFTDGPYGLTRNPIFLAVIAGQVGFFLALPSVFSLVCLIAGVAVLVRQSRVEEEALARHFGQAYEAYRASTPRWLPIHGGLRHPGKDGAKA